MMDVTLCLLIRQGKVLLGNKKRGFGRNKLNGFRGKVGNEETIEQTAIRELYEEVGLKTTKDSLKKVGELAYTFPAPKEQWSQVVHVFLIEEWENEPKESEEMIHEWFDIDKIPFDRTWDSDKYWMPLVLNGKRIKANFIFNNDNETIKTKEIFEIN